MKIFLTEMEEFGQTYAGPNIVAPNLQEAEEAASKYGCVGAQKMDNKWMPCKMH